MAAAAIDRDTVQRALRRAWFPVARVEDLGRPQHATLLGEELVVFRTAGGTIAVTSNRCPHRGAGLAGGIVAGESIACPYHGWEWRAGDGVCTRIPSLPDQAAIPANVQVKTYPVEQRFGLAWTCLDEPRTGVPAPSELDALDWSFGLGEPIPVPVGIAAATENFRDVAHFPFVHRVTMGERPHVVEPLMVRREGIDVWLDWDYVSAGVPGSSLWEQSDPVVFRYHLVAPSFVSLVMDYGAGGKRILLNAASPHDHETSTVFWVEGITSDYSGASVDECIAVTSQVYAEDNPILATIRPREVPFGEGLEFSTASDRYTLAYRRAFLEFVARATSAGSADASAVTSTA